MDLWSNDFAHGDSIPGDFAFGLPDRAQHMVFGRNRNPHLAWSGVPEGTRSLALIVHDRDVPTRPDDVNQEGREVPADLLRADFFHWVVVDLDPERTEISPGVFSDGLVPRGKDVASGPDGTRQGLNDYTGWFGDDPDMGGEYFGYDGPCPPWNDSLVHHYEFSIFALDTERLEVETPITGAGAREAMAGHVLASAVLVGTYTLNQRLL